MAAETIRLANLAAQALQALARERAARALIVSVLAGRHVQPGGPQADRETAYLTAFGSERARSAPNSKEKAA